MPIQKKQTCKPWRRRRRLWLMLVLLPATGCSSTVPWSRPRLPWTANESAEQIADQQDRIASAEQPLFQTAAFKMQTQADSASLVDFAEAIIDAVDGSVETVQQLPAPLTDLPPEALTTDSNIVPSDTPAAPQVIDLASALGMAGGNAWTIQLARQRTVEAHADLKQAQALWLPSLQFGVGWNKHDGRIQATPGNVIEASRSSLFVGGGATLGTAPVAGGSGGPLRLSADLALADAFFGPKIAGRQLAARQAGVSVARNQALVDAGVAYVDLLEAASQVADAQTAMNAAGELLNLTRTFTEAGAGAQANVDRAATEEARLAQQLQDANRLLLTRSATLARRLRLDPRFSLQPADPFIVPIELSADSIDLESQIGTALAQRPEIQELSQEIAGLCLAVRKAEIEPWIPQVAMTTSAGNFGGGNGSSLDNRAGRSDVDLQALWQLDSLGLGVAASRSRAGSQLAQQRTALADLRDQITADVVAAYENVLNYRAQIEVANQAMEFAEASFQRNLQRVRADEGLPIELLQAITAQANTLRDRTTAVANYNRSQLQLLYATGQLRH